MSGEQPAVGNPGAGPMLRILGPVEVEGLDVSLTSQQLALVTYLVCVGPADRDRLIDALWDGRVVSPGRFANLVSETRRRLGSRHLPPARAGRYRVVAVETDLDRLLDLAGHRSSARPAASGGPEAEAVVLDAALALVRGPVLVAPDHRSWRWLDSHPEVVGRAEAAVADLSLRLAERLIVVGRFDRAQEVCEDGLARCPLDRELTLALASLHRQRGRPVAAHRLVERWRHQVRRLTGGDPLIDQASRGTAVTTTLPR